MPFQGTSSRGLPSCLDLFFTVFFELGEFVCFETSCTESLTFFVGCCRSIPVSALRFPNFLGEEWAARSELLKRLRVTLFVFWRVSPWMDTTVDWMGASARKLGFDQCVTRDYSPLHTTRFLSPTKVLRIERRPRLEISCQKVDQPSP